MPQHATRYDTAWHDAEDAWERAWLDAWMRGVLCPVTLTLCPGIHPAEPVQDLATAGSC
jgi:hypothetical protein